MTINLNRLWCEGIDDRPAVLRGAGEVSSRRAIFAAAQKVSEKLIGKRVAIFCASSELEAVAFLAAMRVSAPVIFPATVQAASLREIGEAFDILLTDENVPQDIDHIVLEHNSAFEQENVTCLSDPIDPNLKMTFFTSGSTGKPKEITKYFYQMDREIRAWEGLLGEMLKGTEVHATVSHQHIYGLLFRLLWPLCSGRPFTANTAKNWEDIAHDTEAGRPFLLVSSPTHLSRLTPLENKDVEVRPVLTLSAAGVLRNQFAAQAAQHLGRPVHEIYGSTETGAIARRFNAGADESWECLPNVAVSLNDKNCLQVQSDFLTEGEGYFQTEDLAVIREDGSFTLQGRADRIVKVEGKRVSLPRLEEILRSHNWVQDIHVKLVDRDWPVLGAVVVLSVEGRKYQSEQGNFRISRVLRDHIKKFEDAVTAPRKWRFMDQIPTNPQGKIRAIDIDILFIEAKDKSLPDREIFTRTSFQQISCDEQDGKTSIRFSLPNDLDFFKGHFTNEPLLPGVVQVHWAAQKSIEIFGFSGQPEKIEKLKFKQFLFPNMEAIMVLEQKKPGRVDFLYYSLDKLGTRVEHSSGVLQFRRSNERF